MWVTARCFPSPSPLLIRPITPMPLPPPRLTSRKQRPPSPGPTLLDITYGTALSGPTRRDGLVPGTLSYTPGAGTVLHASNGQTLSVSFTPTDSTDYTNATATATINVQKATPTITWANPLDITYGTALSSTELNASASVPGSFDYTPAAGSVLSAGDNQLLSVTFTPSDGSDFNGTSATATINIHKVALTITWASPASITYGTPLSSSQLDATAAVPGTFAYTPSLGTVLTAGVGQTLKVDFTPTDTTSYSPADATVTIDVTKATPTLNVSAPGGTFNGTPLPASATISGINSIPAASLESVKPTMAYYVGSDTSGMSLGSVPPTHTGRYTVVVSFAGSAITVRSSLCQLVSRSLAGVPRSS